MHVPDPPYEDENEDILTPFIKADAPVCFPVRARKGECRLERLWKLVIYDCADSERGQVSLEMTSCLGVPDLSISRVDAAVRGHRTHNAARLSGRAAVALAESNQANNVRIG